MEFLLKKKNFSEFKIFFELQWNFTMLFEKNVLSVFTSEDGAAKQAEN